MVTRWHLAAVAACTFWKCSYCGLITAVALLNGCGSERRPEPVAVTDHIEDVKRLSSTAQAIDYSRYATYPMCRLDAWDGNDVVSVKMQPSCVKTLFDLCGSGIPVEPLNLLDAHAELYFLDKDEDIKTKVVFFGTRQDEIVIRRGNEWLLLDGSPDAILNEMKSLIASSRVNEKP